jgi:hypothetical protein
MAPVPPMQPGLQNYLKSKVTQAGPPQQKEGGFLEYPGGVNTWKTSGGRYEGGTGVSAPGEDPKFFDKRGRELKPNKDEAGSAGEAESGRSSGESEGGLGAAGRGGTEEDPAGAAGAGNPFLQAPKPQI